jgi:hypothetical protein
MYGASQVQQIEDNIMKEQFTRKGSWPYSWLLLVEKNIEGASEKSQRDIHDNKLRHLWYL